MAETTRTLRPLTSAQRTELDPRDEDDILQQARDRFALALEAESTEREDQAHALDFRAGEHWPPGLKAQRSIPGQERPCLVIPRQETYIRQVVNNYRKAPLGMKVRPKGGGSSKEVADILEGKLREIEQVSEADISYSIALDQAAGQGLGYFRLTTDYEDEYSFQQCVRVKPIYNRFSVYLDPASVHPGALDAEWGFVVERMPMSSFLQYYEVQPADVDAWCGTGDTTWRTKTDVQVAEYFYRVWDRATIVQMPDGTVLPTDGMKDQDIDPTWPTRETRLPSVHWIKFCGYHVLEKTRWLGRYIPIIRVEGQRLDKDGMTQRTGMVQASMDAQLSIDFYKSAEAEAIALAPKAPYKMAAEQIAGYEWMWEQANDAQLPYLLYKSVVVGGTLLPPPQRDVSEPAIQAITQAQILAQQDLQACLGMYAASVGDPGTEKNAAAEKGNRLEGEQSNYGYSANLAWSIRACGTQILDLLPKLYGTPTNMRQVGPDGAVTHTPVNQPYRDEQGQVQEHVLAQGDYEVVVSAGPSYETNRMEVAEKLGTMLAAVQPEVQRYFLDTWAQALDFPGSQDLAQRFKSLVPPEALAASEQKDPRTQLVTLQNQVQQATQQLQQMQQQLQQSQQTEQAATQQLALTEKALADAKVRLDNKQQELQLDAQKADIDFKLSQEANQIKWHELELRYGIGQPNGALLPQNGTEVTQ